MPSRMQTPPVRLEFQTPHDGTVTVTFSSRPLGISMLLQKPAHIIDVIRGSHAQAAGVETGWIIKAINGRDLSARCAQTIRFMLVGPINTLPVQEVASSSMPPLATAPLNPPSATLPIRPPIRDHKIQLAKARAELEDVLARRRQSAEVPRLSPKRTTLQEGDLLYAKPHNIHMTQPSIVLPTPPLVRPPIREDIVAEPEARNNRNMGVCSRALAEAPKSNGKSTTLQMERFIAENRINKRAAGYLRKQPAHVQKGVLLLGQVATYSNAAAVIFRRIGEVKRAMSERSIDHGDGTKDGTCRLGRGGVQYRSRSRSRSGRGNGRKRGVGRRLSSNQKSKLGSRQRAHRQGWSKLGSRQRPHRQGLKICRVVSRSRAPPRFRSRARSIDRTGADLSSRRNSVFIEAPTSSSHVIGIDLCANDDDDRVVDIDPYM